MLEKLNEDSLREIVEKVPLDWMSASARNFVVTLMSRNAERIQGFIK